MIITNEIYKRKNELQVTIKLIKKGLSYAEISVITGRDANAIRVKAGKLKILVTEYRVKKIRRCINCDKEIS